jgi:hypothetical protein
VSTPDEGREQRRIDPGTLAEFGGSRQASGIRFRPASARNNPFIARHLSLAVHCARYRPRRGMHPDYREQKRLHESRPVVAALHVRVLVKDDLIELPRRQRTGKR